MILSFIEKVTNWTQSLALFTLNVAIIVDVPTCLTSGLPAKLDVLDISDIIYSFIHFYTQLIKYKSRYIQKLLKYFNGATNSVSNILALCVVFFAIFVLCSIDLLVFVLLLFILKLFSCLFSSSFTSSL